MCKSVDVCVCVCVRVVPLCFASVLSFFVAVGLLECCLHFSRCVGAFLYLHFWSLVFCIFCVFIFGRCVVPFSAPSFLSLCGAFLCLHFWSLCGAVFCVFWLQCARKVSVCGKGW